MALDRMEPEPLYTQEQFDEILLEWNKVIQDEEQPEKLSFFVFNPNNISDTRIDSLALPDRIKRNMVSYRAAGGSFKTKDDFKKLYGMNDSIFETIKAFIDLPDTKNENEKEKKIVVSVSENIIEEHFDPNTASASVLETYGLNSFQTNNIIAYRNSGGTFKNDSDLLKIYGLDATTFMKISSYVEINNVPKPEEDNKNEKIVVELNSADTTDLMRINGIGPVFASRIIKYRNLLGGFYTKQQLMEVYGFSDEDYSAVEPYILIDTTAIKQIRINYVDYKELIRHPYFDKAIVDALLEEKDNHGPIKNVSDIVLLENVDSEFVEKVRPYITCR
ncbi:MAG TPA: helix-hairpin-helix domain-containing protein [Draconibacterium sp.]|nr:helix-hairpin-helix domain-containing protein [Draconibacterium sp.]